MALVVGNASYGPHAKLPNVPNDYTRERRPHLAKANLALEKLRYFIRLAVEMQLLDPRGYEFAARSIDEIGRQVGGWLKATHVQLVGRNKASAALRRSAFVAS